MESRSITIDSATNIEAEMISRVRAGNIDLTDGLFISFITSRDEAMYVKVENLHSEKTVEIHMLR
jgi:hypothetical protein